MKNKYLGLICLLYSALIIYNIIFDNLKNFLAPTMQIYLKISILPLLILGITLLIQKENTKVKLNDLILILPLIMLILAQDAHLNSNFASNRMSIKTTQETTKKDIQNEQKESKQEDSKQESPEENQEPKIDPQQKNYDYNKPDFDVINESYDELASYFDFVPSSNKYIGKTIKLKGFVVKKDTYIPQNHFALGKYTISCCAADATFLGFIVEENNIKVENDKWYELFGVLKESPDKTNGVQTVIEIISLKEIDGSKEEQFVYPCYAYDDGSCAEISKYNLEYE